jgi:hypothetical protein
MEEVCMSTIVYASLANRRESAPAGSRGLETQNGVSSYLDAAAALVPAEVLSLHAVILSLATRSSDSGATVITDVATLRWAFFGMIFLSVVFYAMPRIAESGHSVKLNALDLARALIPPLAFIAWTMLQPLTAFDAVFPEFTGAGRSVAALFLAVLLGIAATFLAKLAADRKPVVPTRLPADPPGPDHSPSVPDHG